MSASARPIGSQPRCNIGPAEIARRRRIAVATTIVVIVFVVGGVLVHAPLAVRLVLWPIASGTAVTWLQVIRKFCVRFGALGAENFGLVGRMTPVDETARRQDRRLAAELVAQGLGIGLVATVVFALLPG